MKSNQGKSQNQNIRRELSRLHDIVDKKKTFSDIVTKCEDLKRAIKIATKIETDKLPVLISGEDGTGKTLLAKAIHYNNRENAAPISVIDCKSTNNLPINQKISEVAEQNATILIHDICQLDKSNQHILLQILKKQARLPIDFIVSTSSPIEDLEQGNTLQRELYYLLSTHQLKIPALRDRINDIILLARYFTKIYSKQHNKEIHHFTKKMVNLLLGYKWPGNVTELKYSIQKAIILSKTNYLDVHDFPVIEQKFSDNTTPLCQAGQKLPYSINLVDENNNVQSLDNYEAEIIRQVVYFYSGNISLAAKALGISRSRIYRKLGVK